MYSTGDRLTNAVIIYVDIEKYKGGLAIPVYIKHEESHYVDSPASEKDKRPKREKVVSQEPFLLPIALLIGCRPGEYVKLHVLVDEYERSSNPYNPDSSGGEFVAKAVAWTPVYEVSYDEDFRNIGTCTLTNTVDGQQTSIYSRRLDEKVARRYFLKHPEIPIGRLSLEAQYYVTNVYRGGKQTKSWVRAVLSDRWVERTAATTKVKVINYVRVSNESGTTAKIKLDMIKHDNSI